MAKKKFDYDGDGVPNTKKDKAMADQDLNNDGRINKKDKTLEKDTLSIDMLGVNYSMAMDIVSGHPDLQVLFEEAVSSGFTKDMFQARLQGTGWYEQQGTEYARKAWMSQREGGKQWDDQIEIAKDTIQRTASSLGTPLTQEVLDKYAMRYISEGWYEQSRRGMMLDALASFTDITKGSAATTTQELRKLAYDNGIKVTDQWLTETTQSITRGESSKADWDSWIREQAIAKHPAYAERIKTGVTVRSLASPFTSRMAELHERDEAGISLDDPLITQAMGGLDENGNPKSMDYAKFETMLREDPRWEKTINGEQALMGAVTSFAKQWGFIK